MNSIDSLVSTHRLADITGLHVVAHRDDEGRLVICGFDDEHATEPLVRTGQVHPMPSINEAWFLDRNLDRIRQNLMREQNGRCIYCGRAVGLALHHIKFRSESRDDRRENLCLSCNDCHSGAHKQGRLL